MGENTSEWPSFNDPYYVWKKGLKQKTSNKKPDGFSLKKYKKGDDLKVKIQEHFHVLF